MKPQALHEALLAHLRGASAPAASRDLARRFLKIASDDEETCRRLLVPLLAAVPEVSYRAGQGWISRRGADRVQAKAVAPAERSLPRTIEETPELYPAPGSLLDFIAVASDGAGPGGSGSVRVATLLPVLAGEPCQEERFPEWSPGEDEISVSDAAGWRGAGGAAPPPGPDRDDLEALIETVGDLPLVGHRIAREVEPIRRACAALGLALRSPCISAAKLGHLLLGLKANHTSLELAAALGLQARGPDDGRGRVRLMAESYLRLVPLLHARGIETLEGLIEFQDRPAAPRDLSRYAFTAEDLKALPGGPGVYRFVDKEGAIIYVGKAKNLRQRVGSYFTPSAGGTAKGRAILDQVDRLEIEPVASELEAVLVEAALLAEHRPRLNRQFEVHDRPAPYGPRLNLAVVTRDAATSGVAQPCTIHFTRAGRYLERVRLPGGPPDGEPWGRATLLLASYFSAGAPDPRIDGSRAGALEIDWQLVASFVRKHRDTLHVLDLDECAAADEAAARLRVLIDAAQAGVAGRVVAR